MKKQICLRPLVSLLNSIRISNTNTHMLIPMKNACFATLACGGHFVFFFPFIFFLLLFFRLSFMQYVVELLWPGAKTKSTLLKTNIPETRKKIRESSKVKPIFAKWFAHSPARTIATKQTKLFRKKHAQQQQQQRCTAAQWQISKKYREK